MCCFKDAWQPCLSWLGLALPTSTASTCRIPLKSFENWACCTEHIGNLEESAQHRKGVGWQHWSDVVHRGVVINMHWERAHQTSSFMCVFARKMCKNNKANELQFSNKVKGKRMRVTSFERGWEDHVCCCCCYSLCLCRRRCGCTRIINQS